MPPHIMGASLPIGSRVVKKLRELFDLRDDRAELYFVREKIRHLQQKQSRERGRHESVVGGVTQSSSRTALFAGG